METYAPFPLEAIPEVMQIAASGCMIDWPLRAVGANENTAVGGPTTVPDHLIYCGARLLSLNVRARA